MLFALCFFITARVAPGPSALMLAGERVRFNADGAPQFSKAQVLRTAEATRLGLAKWARTAHGRKLIAYFDAREYEIRVAEDSHERAAGRAPQPGIATLVAAYDHVKAKSYDLILNPAFFRLPAGMEGLPNEPSTSADLMAVAWAGEMLHIYFYALGISLPHHRRADFQEEWRAIAMELGLPRVTHDDGDL